jgi:hypothetical protein
MSRLQLYLPSESSSVSPEDRCWRWFYVLTIRSVATKVFDATGSSETDMRSDR